MQQVLYPLRNLLPQHLRQGVAMLPRLALNSWHYDQQQQFKLVLPFSIISHGFIANTCPLLGQFFCLFVSFSTFPTELNSFTLG